MATFTVTTLLDETFEGSETSGAPDGAGLSLREALALANGNGSAEPDEITFAAGLAGGTLFLTTGQHLSITTDGISINGDIDGDEAADIEISADSAEAADDATSSVFAISDGNGATTIAATLNGLVIRDGSGGSGGGILVGEDEALTLTNATVSGNSATYFGGGIFGGEGSSITLTNTTVSGNSAPNRYSGGGIFGSSITLTNSTVTGNSAGAGGGIYGNNNGSITLTNATVSGNSATYFGGGIHGLFNNTITLTNSTVTGNSSVGDGGGISIFGSGGIITLANSIVAGNAADDAGDDLFDVEPANRSNLVFTGGNIIGSDPVNFAPPTGAPTAQIDGTSQAELETVFAAAANNPNTNVLSGVLADNGGAVATIALNPDATNPAIDTGTGALPADTHDLDGDGNTAEALPVDARGFARDVDFDGAPPTPDLGAFEQQNAQSLVVTTLDDELDAADTNLATVNLDDLSLREALALANDDPTAGDTITFAAALAGGTLFLSQDQQLAITTDGISIDGDIDGDGDADITIDADSAAGLDDAASRVFLIDGAGTIASTLNGLVIRDGNAAAGGGIFVGQADALTLTNATVSGNSASFGGGILGQDGSSITLTNATVSGNSGGGIWGGVNAAITLTNATVSGNSASFGGGGIFGSDGSSITLTNATVSGNSAHVGGGIYGGGSSSITLTNTTVSGNSASDGGGIFGGGILGFSNTPITVTNSTVTGNSAGDDGGGIYSANTTALTNSIVAGNAAASVGDDLFGGTYLSAGLVFTGGNIIGSAPENFALPTGTPTATIDGADQAALETVFAQVALVDPDGTGGLDPFFAGVLADNGGAVATIALNPDATNPAIDTGTAILPADTHDLDGDGNTTEALPVDARGFARDVDFDGTPPTPDLGAFEQQNAADFIVTTLADGGADDFGGGDLAAEQADGDGLSLREALGLANGDPTNLNSITFDPLLAGGVLFLQSGELAITTDGITVDGDIDHDGTPDITIDADSGPLADDAASRVFLISDGGSYTGVSIAAALNGLVIRDGNLPGPLNREGGGIYVGYADALTLTNAIVSGSRAPTGGGIGGNGFAAITLTNVTLSGNSASVGGGVWIPPMARSH